MARSGRRRRTLQDPCTLPPRASLNAMNTSEVSRAAAAVVAASAPRTGGPARGRCDRPEGHHRIRDGHLLGRGWCRGRCSPCCGRSRRSSGSHARRVMQGSGLLVILFFFGLAGGVVGRMKGSSFFIWFLVSGLVPFIGLLAAVCTAGRTASCAASAPAAAGWSSSTTPCAPTAAPSSSSPTSRSPPRPIWPLAPRR